MSIDERPDRTPEQQALLELAMKLQDIQVTMHNWVKQSRSNGWLTYQVELQRELAIEIGELLAKHKPVLAANRIIPAGPDF